MTISTFSCAFSSVQIYCNVSCRKTGVIAVTALWGLTFSKDITSHCKGVVAEMNLTRNVLQKYYMHLGISALCMLWRWVN